MFIIPACLVWQVEIARGGGEMRGGWELSCHGPRVSAGFGFGVALRFGIVEESAGATVRDGSRVAAATY